MDSKEAVLIKQSINGMRKAFTKALIKMETSIKAEIKEEIKVQVHDKRRINIIFISGSLCLLFLVLIMTFGFMAFRTIDENETSIDYTGRSIEEGFQIMRTGVDEIQSQRDAGWNNYERIHEAIVVWHSLYFNDERNKTVWQMIDDLQQRTDLSEFCFDYTNYEKGDNNESH